MRLFRSVGAMETIAAYHKNQFYMANLFIYLFVCLFFSFHAASIDYKRHKTKLNDYHLYVCNNSGSYKKVIKFCLFGGSTRAFTFYLKKKSLTMLIFFQRWLLYLILIIAISGNLLMVVFFLLSILMRRDDFACT